MADPKPMSVNEVVELLANPKEPLPIDRVLATLAEWHPLPARVADLEIELGGVKDARDAANKTLAETRAELSKCQSALESMELRLQTAETYRIDAEKDLGKAHETIRESKRHLHTLAHAQKTIRSKDEQIAALNAELDKAKEPVG